MHDKQKLKLVLPLPQSVNSSKIVKNGRIIHSQKTKNYLEHIPNLVSNLAHEHNWKMSDNPNQYVIANYTMFLPRVNCDAENFIKTTNDAITQSKSVWLDDNVVIPRIVDRFVDKDIPRVEVEIYLSDKVGIFKNQGKADKFIDNCKRCSRYRLGKCSILTGASQNKIVDGLVYDNSYSDFTCNKYKEKR